MFYIRNTKERYRKLLKTYREPAEVSMNSQRQEIRYELLNVYIYRDLTQLEFTIQHQIDHNWKTEPLVSQKFNVAFDSVILHMGMEEDDDKEATLRKVHDYLKDFRVSDEALSVSLTDSQRSNYRRIINSKN